MKNIHINFLEKISLIIKVLKNNSIKKLPFKFKYTLLLWGFKQKIIKFNKQYITNSFIPPFPSEAFDRCIENLLYLKQNIISCHIAISDQCSYSCNECSNNQNSIQSLPTAEILNLIKDLQAKGISNISFTGGEPLLRDDLAQIISSVGKKTTSFLLTTGEGLTSEKALQLKESGLFSMCIRLDHNNQQINDDYLGKKGAFKNAINAIKLSQKSGLYTVVQTIIRENNSENILDFLKFLNDLKVNEVRLYSTLPSGSSIDKLQNDHKEIAKTLRIVHKQANRSKDYPKVNSLDEFESPDSWGCLAGLIHIYIENAGNICPCDFTDISFGNIKNESFNKIYKRIKNEFNCLNHRCLSREIHCHNLIQKTDKLPLNHRANNVLYKVTNSRSSKFYKLLEPYQK